MSSTLALNAQVIRNKALTAAAAVAASLVLPQLFHFAGMVSGLGAAPGAAFLPMQIPVFLAGFLAGPVAGIAAGILSPLVSHALAGMPATALLPVMTIELAGYGLIAGLLCNVKMPFIMKLIIAQIAGRVLRAAVLMSFPAIWEITLAGIPGILLQWALIPLLMYRLEGLKQKL
ncbi:MAG: hypothetical protein LBB56_08830 [Chitinispirillales bacterium]|jgi:LytS/YehU family sensor histidine kinase|nr:hypothetical protein [Chitinispirillales bacterium]